MLTKEDLLAIKGLIQTEIKGGIHPLKQDITHVRKDMKVMLSFIDSEYVDLRARVERLEEILKVS